MEGSREYGAPPAPLTSRGPVLTDEMREEARALIVEAVRSADDAGRRLQRLRHVDVHPRDMVAIKRAEAEWLDAVRRRTKALLRLEDLLGIKRTITRSDLYPDSGEQE